MKHGLVMGLLVVAGALSAAVGTAQDVHVVELPETTVQLSADQWRRLDSPEPYAERFEGRVRRRGDVLAQVLTFVRLPMQSNDRVGLRVAPNEHLEFLFLSPVNVTLRLRVERNAFWVESMETFEVPIGSPLAATWRLRTAASEEDTLRLLELYDPEVKRTRFQLSQLFGR